MSLFKNVDDHVSTMHIPDSNNFLKYVKRMREAYFFQSEYTKELIILNSYFVQRKL